MRSFFSVLLGCFLLSSPFYGKAQAFSMACPIPTPIAFWANTDVTTLAISSFSGNIQIDGTFTVNADFTLDGAEVAINTGGSIIVLPGFTLRIINNSILTNIQAVWEGIEVRPGGFLEIEDSDVCGAVTAIEADNGFSATAGSIEIINSGLRFNHTGIELTRYNAAPYPAFIVGTHFEGGVLPFGAPTANSFQGISGFRIDGGTGLTVGDVNTTWAANQFTDMEFGIDVRSSSLQAFNNTFERIQPDALSTSGIAIRAQPNPSGPYVVAVGTATDRANTMTDCRIGVSTVGMGEVNVSDNTMTSITAPFERGVEIEQTRDIVIVAENTIRDFTDIGVFLNEHPGSPSLFTDASINNNTIVGSFGTSQGVFVDEFLGGLAVRDDNDITQVHRAITVQNATPAGPMAGISIDNNTVGFGYPGSGVTSDPAVGILAISVDGPSIDNNTITGNCDFGGPGICTTGTAFNARIRGIQLIFTTDAAVFKNTINDCGGGLYLRRDNLEGNAICNTFFNCFSGVVWDFVQTGEFGVFDGTNFNVFGLAPTASADNQWISPVTGFEPIRSFSINNSDAISVDWFFRTAATFDFPAMTNITDMMPPVSAVNDLPGVATPVCSLLPETGGGQGQNSSLGFDSLSNQQKEHFANIKIEGIENLSSSDYAFLKAAYSASSSNPLIQSVIEMTNISTLSWLSNNWSRLPFDSVLDAYGSVVPINAEEHALHALWGLRIANTLDTNSVDYTIAALSLIEGFGTSHDAALGATSALAGSMLNRAYVPDTWCFEINEESRYADDVHNSFTVFPNPVGDRFFIDLKHVPHSVSIRNSAGHLMWNTTNPRSMLLTVDCNSWSNGLYWITISHLDGSKEQATAAIMR